MQTQSTESLRAIERQRQEKLAELNADPYLGFSTLEEAQDASLLSSQAEVLARLLNRENIFISGFAGSGKTAVINKFIERIDAEYSGAFNVAVTASTGIAATLLGGSTIHSWGGLGISTAPFNPKDIERSVISRFREFKNLDVLIIDEISMLPAYLFTKVDAILKHFRRSKEPFGGVQLVLIGDFLQLPPVAKRGDGEELDTRFAIETQAWKEANIHCCFLDKTYRAKDERLKKLLNEIAKGEVSEESKALVNSRRVPPSSTDKVFTTLYTTNQNVDAFNQKQLAANPEKLVTFRAKEEGGAKDITKLYKKYNLTQELELKKNATVLLTKNTHTPQGLVANGSIGKIIGFIDNNPHVRFNSGITTVITPAPYFLKKKQEAVVNGKSIAYESVIAEIRQLPLKLGYAITVHKSQGQTFDGVVTDLSKCFQPGLGYVALSRVRSIDDLHIMGLSEKAYEVSPKSRKITHYVKKKAYLGRKEFLKNQQAYELLLTDDMARFVQWQVPEDRDPSFSF